MSEPAASRRPVAVPGWVRSTLFIAGLVLLIAALVPPLIIEARRYEYLDGLQFTVFAAVVPALVVLGSPWKLFRLARRTGSPDEPAPAEPSDGSGGTVPSHREALARSGRLMERFAERRRRRLEVLRSIFWLVLFMTAVVLWRTPPAVNGVVHHPWLVAVEAVTLVGTGIALWLELVDSPPVAARSIRPIRIALAAFAMWTLWVPGYLVGMAHGTAYFAYHAAGSKMVLSTAADQEITTFVMLFISGVVFVPLIFWNLVTWLASDDDPDHLMHRLVREERRRSLGPNGA